MPDRPYYLLASYPAGDLAAGGDLIGGRLAADHPFRLRPSAAEPPITSDLTVLLDAAADQHTCRLLTVWPLGTLTRSGPHLATSPGGWTILSVSADLSPLLGPQAARVLAMTRRALDALPASRPILAETYLAEIPDPAAYADARGHALDALTDAGADRTWITSLFPGALPWGSACLAVAARHLIRLGAWWDRDAYARLAWPWTVYFGQPACPGDGPIGSCAQERHDKITGGWL